MDRLRTIIAVTGTFGGSLLLAGACLLVTPANADAQGTGQVKGNVGRFFFGPSDGGRGPDRWGAPRLGDDRRHRPRHRINVRTVAGKEPVFQKPDRRSHRRKRPRIRRPLRPAFPTVIHVTSVNVRVDGEPEGPPARKKAVRRSDVVRSRRRADTAAASDAGASAPAGPDAPPAATAPGEPGRAGPPRAGVEFADRSPLVLAPPEEDAEGRTAERDCALVKIRTPEGIAWSQQVSLDALDVSSISGASSVLRSEIRRGTPLVFRNGEGEFTVPGSRVESLTVGPCPRR